MHVSTVQDLERVHQYYKWKDTSRIEVYLCPDAGYNRLYAKDTGSFLDLLRKTLGTVIYFPVILRKFLEIINELLKDVEFFNYDNQYNSNIEIMDIPFKCTCHASSV